ncbi:MAG: hypothetical protein EON90_04570 [Brevundimonas sp.]|nr:MAG: hypothetical protein EON90_04570 [Brevundimonas sp.]
MAQSDQRSLNDLDWSGLREARASSAPPRRRIDDHAHMRKAEPEPDEPTLPFESLDKLDNFVPFGRLK